MYSVIESSKPASKTRAQLNFLAFCLSVFLSFFLSVCLSPHQKQFDQPPNVNRIKAYWENIQLFYAELYGKKREHNAQLHFFIPREENNLHPHAAS